MAKAKTAITPTRSDDYPEWYQQVIKAADLAENAPVRGCMVIKPWGYTLWENVQRDLDVRFKATGHVNAYFPLFIPKSYLEKEAAHVEGFAKECAVVTHSRLVANGEGGLKPDSPLEEPLIVRPTSETIIGEMYAKWVQSYRDLPILINQWANVVRWEMRTRLFLRTAEFLWQEGHTVHATAEEAMEETRKMLQVYADFAQDVMAMPVICGEKTAGERFPGADHTFSIEAMMQDRKALQAGTSHFLGQNFSKASEIKFQNEAGQEQYAWTTSWGVSTRLLGALIMTHSDDDGLVLPPKLAPAHVVILPVMHKPETAAQVLEYAESLKAELQQLTYNGQPLLVELDKRDLRGGEKRWSWVKKGVPLIVEAGPRDREQGAVFVARRDTGEKAGQPRAEFVQTVTQQLQAIQENLFQRAADFRAAHTQTIDTLEDFKAYFTPQNTEQPEIHGGFALAHWGGDAADEDRLAKEMKVTIRNIPLEGQYGYDGSPGTCVYTGKPSPQRVVFAKSY
ncbi:MAG: proline--tRNA ligase [Verrucomicrobiota bacterium]